jgi:UDP-glucose 4-epimerase
MDQSDATTVDTTPIRGRTILVTGGAGFVGSHLADALVGDNEVRVVDDLTNGRPENVPEGATFIEGDIRDDDVLARAMDGVDIVFHQAGLVSVPASVEDPAESQDRNAAATLAVLERARSEDARVVLASSVAIYGDPDVLPVSEEDPEAAGLPVRRRQARDRPLRAAVPRALRARHGRAPVLQRVRPASVGRELQRRHRDVPRSGAGR